MTSYYTPPGGLPPQTSLMTGRAMFTEAFAFIPKGCFSDIVTSFLPHWHLTRLWLIARPMSGFSETFSQYVVEIQSGGGSDLPDADSSAEHFLFMTKGAMQITLDGTTQPMAAGSYAFIPPGCKWAIHATEAAHFHWIRKRYQKVDGIPTPAAFVTREADHPISLMPNTNGVWGTTRFVDPADMSHDAHVNIVTFQPGGVIPFEETHVMEHGLYVLEGKAAYKLNQTWVEVEAGDFMWLRAFCPQACYAAGPGPFRYLLYKDVNRHASLGGVLGR
jgi:(S)-ureidoglycine aminohydrolase